jgi:hypothetical protein
MTARIYPLVLGSNKGWGVFFLEVQKGIPLYRYRWIDAFDNHGRQLGRVQIRGDKSGDKRDRGVSPMVVS